MPFGTRHWDDWAISNYWLRCSCCLMILRNGAYETTESILNSCRRCARAWVLRKMQFIIFEKQQSDKKLFVPSKGKFSETFNVWDSMSMHLREKSTMRFIWWPQDHALVHYGTCTVGLVPFLHCTRYGQWVLVPYIRPKWCDPAAAPLAFSSLSNNVKWINAIDCCFVCPFGPK